MVSSSGSGSTTLWSVTPDAVDRGHVDGGWIDGREGVVVVGLQALSALAVAAHVAQHVARERGAGLAALGRVVAHVHGFDAVAGQQLLPQRVAHLGALLRGQLACRG